MVTPDEVLVDDIVGLIDFNGSVSPRLLMNDAGVLMGAVFPQDVDSLNLSTGSGDGANKPYKRPNRRELQKNRQRKHRQRLKASREELERQVCELTKQLLLLSKKPNALTSCLWVAEAAQERIRRTQSETEQQRLVAAVNHQAAYIKGLRQVVGKRLHGCTTVPVDDAVRVAYFNKTRIMHSVASTLYTTDMRQLEDCYARVDNVMSSCGMITLSETTMDTTHRRVADRKVAYYQHVHKAAIPYSYDQVCTALWNAVYENEELEFRGYESTSDIIIKSRIRAIKIGSMMQRCISRIYKEDNRLVRVLKISTEGEGAFSGLYAEDSCWTCVRPTKTGVMLEVCVQQAPMRFKASNNQEPAISKFHNMLHECLETDKTEMENRIQKLLLDDDLTEIER